tara:strand:+ start:877 stop:1227 length:351 start_codon:yes stop_codon:yes gene_type:complete
MKYYEKVFLFINYFIYCMYFFVYFKLWNDAPQYLDDAQFYLKLFVGILIVYFFNPFASNNTFTKFHKQVVFSAGLFLLTSLSLESILNHINSTGTHILGNISNIYPNYNNLSILLN